ncbi:ATP synthase mitochondrial F1 complex assembly factor 2 isoform X2 [Centruroides vittatus]|uniref:ATP synthase mitochondrial F1 complex assembly factor 2 isoform X2 n=1 Tax=Centruroides vittatus TaxID=120091 RepID=UPI00350FEC58
MATSIFRGVFLSGFCTKYSSFTIFKRFYPALPKRFYKNVSITNANGSYEVNLDNRKLKTPKGNIFKVSNEALAILVATEWDSQQQHIMIPNMHVTGLCYTAIDNPTRNTKESLSDSIVEMLDSDTLCHRINEPIDLKKHQEENWDPVLQWFEERYKVKMNVSYDVGSEGISDETHNIIKKHLLSYNDWCLLGIQFTAESLKSIILTLAAVNYYLDVESCVSLSYLETLYQIKQWGSVEWAHNIEFEQTKARAAAGVLFVYLNSESTHLSQKSSSSRDTV